MNRGQSCPYFGNGKGDEARFGNGDVNGRKKENHKFQRSGSISEYI